MKGFGFTAEEGGLVWKLESSVDNDIGDGRFWGDDVDQ